MGSKFQIGDEVAIKRFIVNYNELLHEGDIGTVVHLSYGFNSKIIVGVDWHKRVTNGHDCSGYCLRPCGWNMLEEELELVSEKCSISVSVDEFV